MLEHYWQAVLLGIIQGATEFLPVSSSGHLALTQAVLELDAGSAQMLLFDVAMHVATVVAVLVVFRRSFRDFLLRLWRDLRGRSAKNASRPWLKQAAAARVTLLGIAASVPTAAIGLRFKDTFEAAFREPIWIAAGLAVTGTTLLITARRSHTKTGWREFTFLAAIIVGVAQGIAILPGVSRSGATICVALLLGLRRRWAAEFSFFIAVPAILGATLIQSMKLTPEQLASLPVGLLLAGCAAAFVVGVAALRLLLAAVRRAKLRPFAFYCYALAGVVVGLSLSDRL